LKRGVRALSHTKEGGGRWGKKGRAAPPLFPLRKRGRVSYAKRGGTLQKERKGTNPLAEFILSDVAQGKPSGRSHSLSHTAGASARKNGGQKEEERRNGGRK